MAATIHHLHSLPRAKEFYLLSCTFSFYTCFSLKPVIASCCTCKREERAREGGRKGGIKEEKKEEGRKIGRRTEER